MVAALLTPVIGAIAASIVSTVVSLVLSVGLGFLQKAMQKKPRAGGGGGNDQKITVRQPNAPWRVIYGETRVGGIYVYINTVFDNSRLQLVIALAGHEVEEIGDIYFDDEKLTLDDSEMIANGGGGLVTAPAKWSPHVAVHKWLGTADQVADYQLIAESPDKWTADHRLRGRAYIVVFMNYLRESFPNGVPNITAVVKGKKVYDSRTTLTAYSANAALCTADYLASAAYGLGAGYGTEIDEDALSVAANICDEAVTLADGGSESRYTINGAFDVDAKPVDIVSDLLNAMAGRAIHAGGRWRVIAGAWQVPAITLDEDDLRGPFKVQSLLSRRENFNAVKGQYVAPGNKYQETDFPAVVSATYQAEDGERIFKDIKLPFTDSPARAQRLAKIELLRARQPVTLPDVPFHLSAYRVQCGDVIGISNTRMGWTDKAFEVTQATLAFDRSEGEAPLIGVNLSLRETASTIYDWSTSEESTVDPAPNTNLPDAFNVIPPGGIAVAEAIYVTRQGDGVKAMATVFWIPSFDGFARSYEVEYQLAGATDWTTAGDSRGHFLEIFDLAPGTYDFRVRTISTLGVRSAWTVHRQQISGLLAAPVEPQNLTLQSIGGLAVLGWTQSPDLDVRIGGRIEFRHSPASGGSATWTQSTTIGMAVPGTTTQTVLPLKAGTYLAKCVDSSGVYSTDAAAVETEQATALAFADVGSITEHPGFTGQKGGTFRDSDDGFLKLTGASEMDDWGDVDAVADWDSEGGLLTDGSYVFSGGLDLGSVERVRLTSHIAATIVNTLDLVDSRSGDVDDWLDWDGTEAASADAWVEVRKTNDDPSGAPTWTDWQRLDAVELVGRGFQFRCQLRSSDPAYNINVEELSVTAAGVV